MSLVADPMALNSHGVANPSGAPVALRAERYSRRQEALAAFGRRAAAPADVARLLQDAASLVAESFEMELCGAIQLNPEQAEFSLRLTGADGGDSVAPLIIEQRGQLDDQSSLVACALAGGESIATADLTDDARFNDRALRCHSIRGALVAPLRLDNQPLGAIAVFSTAPRTFTADELLFAEAIAHLVDMTVGRQQALSALEEERRFSRTVLQTIDAFVLTLDRAGRIVQCNPAFEKMTGFALTEILDRPIWNTLLISDEVTAVRESLEKALKAKQPVEHECFILTKDGERRRVRWSHAASAGAGGKITSLVSTGIDVTRERAAEEKLTRLEAATSNTKNLLDAMAPNYAAPPENASLRPAAAKSAGAPSGVPLAPPAAGQFERLPAGPSGERRKRPRRAFNFQQRIAAVTGGRLPDPRTFMEVNCHDISSGGFSFVLANPPGHPTYVVALGVAPAVIYVLAKVVHTRAMTTGGRTSYIVGCQYTGRADYEK
jgi:PAS domain S-box-containing protein